MYHTKWLLGKVFVRCHSEPTHSGQYFIVSSLSSPKYLTFACVSENSGHMYCQPFVCIVLINVLYSYLCHNVVNYVVLIDVDIKM